MSLSNNIKQIVKAAITDLYKTDIDESGITINLTKPEFEGDYTVVLFALLKPLKKSPDALGNELGKYLVEKKADLNPKNKTIKMLENNHYFKEVITIILL